MIYLFDKDEKLIKIIRKSAVKTALQKYVLTTERYVSDRLTVELKGLNADELEQVEYMAIQTMENAHTFHYFYVAQKFSDELTTLIGVQSGIEELRKSPVFDKRPKNSFARDVITDLLNGTNWQARFVGETTPHSTNFYYTSIFDALKKVCEVWDLEMQFFVEMNGNRIGARYIDFKQRIGEAVGKRVVYGHNALQILQEVERTNIFTALVGRGKGEETGDGYGRKITFENVVWSRTQGKPVDKPKGQKYLELPLMTRQYGIKNADGSMRPKIGFVDFSEEENPEILIERTYKALVDAARPQLTLKTSSVYLKGVKVGDTIRVVRHDKKLDYDTRVFEITFNRLNNQSSDIKLGDRIGESNEAKVQTIADKAVEQFVNNEFSNFVQNLPDYLPSADGFNNNWYGTEDPTVKYPGKVLINDIWFKPDPEHEGHKIMLRWTGEVWEEILRTYESEALRERIAEEIAQVEQSIQAQAQEHDRQVADILSKTQSVEAIVNQAKADAVSALASALQAKADAIAEAKRLDTVERQATETKLATAKAQAVAEASRLVDTAKSALDGRISAVDSNLTQTKEEIKLLATKQSVSDLTGRLSSAESSLILQADQIAQRVKTSDFNQATQRLNTAEASIVNLGNRITTELSAASARIPNEVGGRNYFLESDFTITSGMKTIKIHPDFMRHARGKKFIISVEVEAQNAIAENQSRFGLSTSFGKPNVKSRDWREVWETGLGVVPKKRIYQVFDFKDDWTSIVAYLVVQMSGQVSVGYPKLEIGSIVTDYSKAHEDFEHEISTVKTTITKTAEGQEQLSNKLVEAQGKLTSAETTIRQLVDDVSSKVSQTDFDAVKQTVENNSTAIQQSQAQIALKAEKTYVDGIKTTADNANQTATEALTNTRNNAETIRQTNAELQLTSDAIKTKVSQTDFNQLTGRMDNAETTIQTVAGQIETKLSRTDASGMISNAITQSEKGTTQRIAQVEAKIPTELGSRNYILNSRTVFIATNNINTCPKSVENLKEGNREYLRIRRTNPTLNPQLFSIFSSIYKFSSEMPTSGQGKISFKARASTAVEMNVVGIVISGTTTNLPWNKTQISIGTEWKTYSFDFEFVKGMTILRVNPLQILPPVPNLAEFYLDLCEWQLEAGSMTSSWSLATEELVTTTALHEVKDLVDSHARTIQDQSGQISQLIQTSSGFVTTVQAKEQSTKSELIARVGKGESLLPRTDFSQGLGDLRPYTETNEGVSFNLPMVSPFSPVMPNGNIMFVAIEGDSARANPGYGGFYIPNMRGQAGTELIVKFMAKLPVGYSFNYTDKGVGGNGNINMWLTDRAGTGDWKEYAYYFKMGQETSNINPNAISYTYVTADVSPATQKVTWELLDIDVVNISKNGTTALRTQVAQLSDSWAMKIQNANGVEVTGISASEGGIRLKGRHLHLDGQTLIDDAVIKSAMIDKLKTANFESGSVTSDIIAANAVTADKLVVDQAFFNKLTSDEIVAGIFSAKEVFATKVQAVSISANQVTSGILKATNGAMQLNLDSANITFNQNATINFNSANNALVRKKGGHTAFVHFDDVSASSDRGAGSLYASIGVTSSYDGVNSSSSGRFAGLRVFRGAFGTQHDATVDQSQLYGDTVLIKDDFDLVRGFRFRPSALGIDDLVDINNLVTCVRGLRDMWAHYRNAGPDLVSLLRDRSNPNVNNSLNMINSF